MRVKLYFICVLLLASYEVSSQIGIGRIPSPSAILDFKEDPDNKKGIILPVVTIDSINLSYANGTFIVDRDDKKVKVRWNNKWRALTDIGSFDAQMLGSDPYTTPVSFFATTNENLEHRIVIGNTNSSVDGIMVLDAPDKAVLLPKIDRPHTSVAKPVAGMICYDTESKSVAIFDGKVWSYWK